MPKPRRIRWPNHAEEFRLDALANARHSAKEAQRARELVMRIISKNYHRDDPETVELLLTKTALLLAEIEIGQERIQRILIDAAQGIEKEAEKSD